MGFQPSYKDAHLPHIPTDAFWDIKVTSNQLHHSILIGETFFVDLPVGKYEYNKIGKNWYELSFKTLETDLPTRLRHLIIEGRPYDSNPYSTIQ